MADGSDVQKLIKILNAVLLLFLAFALFDVIYSLAEGSLLYAFASILRTILISVLIFYNRRRNKLSLGFTAFSGFKSMVDIIISLLGVDGKYSAISFLISLFQAFLAFTTVALALIIFRYLNRGNLRDIIGYIKALDSEKSFGKSVYRFMFLTQLFSLTIGIATCTYLIMTNVTSPVERAYFLVGAWAVLCVVATIPLKKDSGIGYFLLAPICIGYLGLISIISGLALSNIQYFLFVLFVILPTLLAGIYLISMGAGMVARFFWTIPAQHSGSQDLQEIGSIEKEVNRV